MGMDTTNVDDSVMSMTTHASAVSASVGHHHDSNLQHRPSMEDEMAVHECEDFPGLFLAVYDGHGGRSAAQYLRQLFHRIFLDELLDEELALAPHNTASIGKRPTLPPSQPALLPKPASLDDEDMLSACSTPPCDVSDGPEQQQDGQADTDMEDDTGATVNSTTSNVIISSSPSLSPSSSMAKDEITMGTIQSTPTTSMTTPLQPMHRRRHHRSQTRVPPVTLEHAANTADLDVKAAFQAAYTKMDAVLKFRNIARLGATAVTAFTRRLRTGERTLTVANCGDSRAVLCRAGRPLELTTSHRPSVPSERTRIESAGGFVSCGRINGVLNVSRAFGDHWMKSLIICTPDITQVTLGSMDDFLVLACDGLWDFVSDDVVITVAQHAFDRGCAPHQVAQALVQEAIHRKGTDNVSVMVVQFDTDEE